MHSRASSPRGVVAGGARYTGSRSAALDIDALYSRHHDELLLYLVRRTADVEVALDLWSETFAQAVAGRGKYRGRTDAEAAAWLYSIAKNQLARYLRRGYAERRAMHKLGLERPPADDELVAEIWRRAQLDATRAELTAALATLSEAVREAVELRVVDERPYGEVARRLRISEQAARARVSRGLSALAEAIEPART